MYLQAMVARKFLRGLKFYKINFKAIKNPETVVISTKSLTEIDFEVI